MTADDLLTDWTQRLRLNSTEVFEEARLFLENSWSSLSPSQRITALLIIARACINQCEPELGAHYALKAYQQSEDAIDSRRMGLSLLEHGVCMFVLARYDEAEADYTKGLHLILQHGTPQDESRFRVNLGNLYSRTERHVEAVKEYERALELTRQTNDTLTQAKILVNISAFFGTILCDYTRAIEYCNEAILIYTTLDDVMGLGKAYANLGMFLSRKGDIHESLEAQQKALVYKLRGVDIQETVVSYYNVISTLAHLNRTDEARSYLIDMLACAEGRPNDEAVARYIDLAKATLEYVNGRTSEAIALWENVRRWMQTTGRHDDLRLVCTFLAQAYERHGRPELAVELLRFVFEHEDAAERNRAAQRLAYVAQTYKLAQERARAEIERLRNVELLEAVKQRQELNHDKERFLAFIAHELKEPLASASAITSLLLHDASLTHDERHDYRDALSAVVDRMNTLVASLIKQRTSVRSETLQNVSEIWGRVVQMWNSRAAAKHIRLSVANSDHPLLIMATEQQLLTIIENLISNAVKYTPQFGSVDITIRPNQHDNVSTAELVVTDTGPGIPQEEQDRLFQPWQTLSTIPTGNETSTGLGLYFVKREVDALGGAISCESRVGHGTTFVVMLPVIPNASKQEVL